MLRDCPHRGEKVRVVHNVQQDETMEDMGRNVPRILLSPNIGSLPLNWGILD
jgi:hypothetical protein